MFVHRVLTVEHCFALVVALMNESVVCCLQEEGILALVIETRNTIHSQVFITVSDLC